MKNVIKAIFSQNLSHVKENGEIVEFKEKQEFFAETAQAITASTLALWCLGQVKHFVKLSRLQGETGFKMSKPIELMLTVNNKTEKLGFKFSLNAERLERLIEKTPELVQEAFTPAPTPAAIIANPKVITNYLLNKGDNVIAKAAKEVKMIEPAKEAIEVGSALMAE